MTIGLKGFAKDAAVPGSFTSFVLEQVFIADTWKVFDSEPSLDGTLANYKRKYKKARIVFHKSYDGTVYTAMETILDAYYVRINDSRYPSTNTIDFIYDGVPEVTRTGPSRVLESAIINLISESPQ
ncbi:hypothetical protein LCGC14_2479760 [marine sediment metagenome]|uniref:Uncharacterized protein n=1 Tax=marine sediment metagenome TaxID=412755 RepID=A0A0F9B8P2_9ZZZZ